MRRFLSDIEPSGARLCDRPARWLAGPGESRVISPVFFPAPSRAFEVLAARFADGSIWPSIEATSLRMLVGLGVRVRRSASSSARR